MTFAKPLEETMPIPWKDMLKRFARLLLALASADEATRNSRRPDPDHSEEEDLTGLRCRFLSEEAYRETKREAVLRELCGQ